MEESIINAITRGVVALVGNDVLQWVTALGGPTAVYRKLRSNRREERQRDREIELRDREIERLNKQWERSAEESVSLKLANVRRTLYEECAKRIAVLEEAETALWGGRTIRVKLKSTPVNMDYSAFLEKLDRHTKDALVSTLSYIIEDYKNHEYLSMDAMAKADRLESVAKHICNNLWTRISKDVGVADLLKEAFDTVLPYEAMQRECAEIVGELIDLDGVRARALHRYDTTTKSKGRADD